MNQESFLNSIIAMNNSLSKIYNHESFSINGILYKGTEEEAKEKYIEYKVSLFSFAEEEIEIEDVPNFEIWIEDNIEKIS